MILRRLIAPIAAALLVATVLTGSPGRANVPPTAKVVFFGDSIMAGAYLARPDLDSIPKRMTDRICGANSACRANTATVAYGGRCLIAAGCAGTPLSQDWVSYLDQYKPTTAVVMIGTNDMGQVDDATIADGYKRLVYPAADRGIRVLIATIPPSCRNWQYKSIVEPQRQRMNSWLKSYFGSPTVWSTDILNWGTDLDPTYAKDGCSSPSEGVHTNFIGNIRVADAFPVGSVQ